VVGNTVFANVTELADGNNPNRTTSSASEIVSKPWNQIGLVTVVYFLVSIILIAALTHPTYQGWGSIWPEYRLHAAVFAMRSMVTILLYHYERSHFLAPNYNYNYYIAMGGMMAADVASYSVSIRFICSLLLSVP
jgi:hypothetical protein